MATASPTESDVYSAPSNFDPSPNSLFSFDSTPSHVFTHPMVTRSHLGMVKHVNRLNLLVNTSSSDPCNYSQAFQDPNWLNVMNDEYNALITNQMWTSVPRPPGANIINCIWLFKKKQHVDGSIARYKA